MTGWRFAIPIHAHRCDGDLLESLSNGQTGRTGEFCFSAGVLASRRTATAQWLSYRHSRRPPEASRISVGVPPYLRRNIRLK